MHNTDTAQQVWNLCPRLFRLDQNFQNKPWSRKRSQKSAFTDQETRKAGIEMRNGAVTKSGREDVLLVIDSVSSCRTGRGMAAAARGMWLDRFTRSLKVVEARHVTDPSGTSFATPAISTVP